MCPDALQEESDEDKVLRLDGISREHDALCQRLEALEEKYPPLRQRNLYIVEGNYSTLKAREKGRRIGVAEAMHALSGVVHHRLQQLSGEEAPKPPDAIMDKYYDWDKKMSDEARSEPPPISKELAEKLVALGMSIAMKGYVEHGLPTGTPEQLPDKDCPSTESDGPTSDGDI